MKGKNEIVYRFFNDIRDEVNEKLGDVIKEDGELEDIFKTTPLGQKYYFLKRIKERKDFFNNIKKMILKVFLIS